MQSAHPGDHACFFYETEAAHERVLTAFLREGLERHEKVLYFIDAHAPSILIQYLRDAPQLGHALASGHLETLSADSVYLRSGAFSAERMLASLTQALRRSVAEGYAGLRVTGEMTWALNRGVDLEQVVAYESSINALFPGQQIIGLCQYDCRRFRAETLVELAVVHPLIVRDGARLDNRHYLTPAEFLSPETCRTALQRWRDPSAPRGFQAFLNSLGDTDSPSAA